MKRKPCGSGFSARNLGAYILFSVSLVSFSSVLSKVFFLQTTLASRTSGYLPPHYICPTCKKLIWGNASEYDCGIDMEAIDCPQCGTDMQREGFTIPFETFLGIPGKIKEPDIDLNFAGEYQSTAHKFVDEIFGAQNVFKAGTIGTLAEKMARGNVLDYCRNTSAILNNFEQERLALGLEGVRKSTGQHPGGIIIVPEGHEIYEFCPVQRPANKTDVDIVTTHFDYHAIDQNLLKLDILGHDAP